MNDSDKTVLQNNKLLAGIKLWYMYYNCKEDVFESMLWSENIATTILAVQKIRVC